MSFDFSTFPILKTERLQLAKLDEKDLEPLIELAAFKVENATRKDAEALLLKTHDQFRLERGITWGLFTNNGLMGTVGYYRGFANKTGEIGYVMCEKFKNRGYLTEAAQAAIDFGFESLGLNRITAYTSITNAPSVRVLEKLGFRNTETTHDGNTIFELLRSRDNALD